MKSNTNHNHHDYQHHEHQHHEHHEHHKEHDHLNHNEHDDHSHHHHGDFKTKFLISLPIGLLIMWISPIMGLQVPFPFQYTFTYSDIVATVLSLALLIYGAKPFFTGALDELKQKSPGMMALVSLGVGVSFIYSVGAVILKYTTGKIYMDFYFEFSSLVLIMLLGHWIEMVALGKAGDAQASLAKLLPKHASVRKGDGTYVQKPITELKVGDIVRIQAGESAPADGKVIKGESRVNEALFTGESKPILKSVGDTIIGGSTNGNSILEVEVTTTGDKTFIAQVQMLVKSAQNKPSRAENNAKKVSGYLFYIALVAALLSFIIWFIIADLENAISFAVTTLVIACPHALGLAIPLVVSRSTSLGAKNGLLVKSREVYNLTTKANTMILDKTGTLTTGDFKVLKIDVLDSNFKEDEITSILSGIEAGSTHPIATSIMSYAESNGIKPIHFDELHIIPGAGVEGKTNNDTYKLISKKSFNEDIHINTISGATLSILTKNDKPIGAVQLGDTLKPSAKHLIQVLKSKGITPILATGDNYESAKAVGDILDIKYFYNQSPEDKFKLVESFKEKGQIVIMVGDGINDAPSLSLADVGIAIGAGTQVAIDSADVVLTNSEPGDIETFINLSFKTHQKMNQNLLWGAGYNFIAIPVAAGILAFINILLTPAIGAALMSLSTLIVAFNAVTLNIKGDSRL